MKSLALMVECFAAFIAADTSVETLQSKLAPLISEHCLGCHDAATKTRLNFEDLAYDLDAPVTFRQWQDVYDRLDAGEMPPKTETQPDAGRLDSAMVALADALREANLQARRKFGRVPARRLTRTEYEYSIRDLLSIEGDFAELLPVETSVGSFDTVGSSQHVSAMHLESYLIAADHAINTAIRLHPNPFRSHAFDLLNNEHLNTFHEREIRIGGNISRKLDDGVAVFRDVDYLLRSDLHGFRIRKSGAGLYRIKVTAEAFQSQTPVAMKIVVKDISGETQLIAACDLVPGKSKTLEAKAWLTRTKVFYVAMAEQRPPAQILADIFDSGGARNYRGSGIHVKSIQVEGPLTGGWPPQSTRNILGEAKLTETSDGDYKVEVSSSPLGAVRDVISQIAPKAFRRPLLDGELDAYTNLAKPAIADGLSFTDALRSPLRAMLSSPQFLLLTGKAGKLNDYALASRLSYFLWETMPDDELRRLAERGDVSKTDILTKQVDRMLSDDRVLRFVRDFSAQWLRLDEIDATTPDEKLYPEYDDILRWSVPQETENFLREMIRNDLSISQLIDSDFTFLNRRLAEHYDIYGVTGQELRRFKLPVDSPRGGLLTQASVLKVTANGLVTSPVKRGAYVLSDLLGTPPPPPPSNVGSIEPDTSGATTVRETLTRHRGIESCAECHKHIDPPGFALESFDPIGGFRTHYRKRFDDILAFTHYEDGPKVDASGVTHDGLTFDGIQEFKQHLMKKKEQLARHFISQLIVYATGGEIEFADRNEINVILNRTRNQDFPVRTIIHAVVQSAIFKHR